MYKNLDKIILMQRVTLLFLLFGVTNVYLSTTAGITVETTHKPKCHWTSDCSQGQCCKTTQGTVLILENQWWNNIQHFIGPGHCTVEQAKNGDFCDNQCTCENGYTCYHVVSGMRQPARCHNNAYVQQQKEYWANCKPPTCFPPP
jgi:hypothetical protein